MPFLKAVTSKTHNVEVYESLILTRAETLWTAN